MKTTSFADCRRFSAAVHTAGGELPQRLKNLIQSHSVLAASTTLPGAQTTPECAIVDAALDGSLTAEKLSKLLPAAASAAATHEYAKGLPARAETVLLGQFHREIGNGGADAILDSMRPLFDKHAKEIVHAKSLFNAESSAEAVLASGEPAVMKAWNELADHIVAVSKIAVVAREFAPRLGMFPQIIEFPGGDGFRLDDTAIMCCDGGLAAESSYFQRPEGPHRQSALFKVSLKLHSITSAQSRYDEWAASEWDAHVGSRPVESRLVDGELIPNKKPENPYRAKVSVR